MRMDEDTKIIMSEYERRNLESVEIVSKMSFGLF